MGTIVFCKVCSNLDLKLERGGNFYSKKSDKIKIMTLESFYKDAEDLIEKVNEFTRIFNVESKAIPDHICFKCDSKEVFESVRSMLEPESVFVYQSYISNRRIAVIKLKKVFETDLGPINTLELSDQKPDNSQATRFDHIELYPLEETYDAFVADLQEKGAKLEKVVRPHHTTYDVLLDDGYQLKLTRDQLIEKIKRNEMN